MAGSRWDVVVDGLGRLEAPCLDLEDNLCFSDIHEAGAIYRLRDNGQLEVVVRGRSHVGGLVPHADGGFVASGHTVAVIDDNGGERVVMTPNGGWGFNDLTTDAAGNVFVGMHGERPTATPPHVEASMWRIADGAITHCYGGIQLTNGVGISPEGDRLYHNDTLRRVIWVSDIAANAPPSNLRVFHEVRDGMPDGMSIDEAGGVWIAAIGVGKVVRVSPDGREDLVVEVPMPYVSALCFGGHDRRDLYITTFGGAPYDLEHTGSVIRTRVDVPGLRVTPARV